MVTLQQRQQFRQKLSEFGDGFVVSVGQDGDFKVLFTSPNGEINQNSKKIPVRFLGHNVSLGTYAQARQEANPTEPAPIYV